MSLVKPKAVITAPTSVQINTQVTLDGTQSTGNIVKWHWIQKKGNKVKINDEFKSVATFTPTKEGPIVIKLKVDDANHQIGRAFITITVTAGPPPNKPPTVNAGSDITVKVNQTPVAIDGSANDLDGTVVRVKWTQIAGTSVEVTEDPTDPTNFTFTAPTTPQTLTFRLFAEDDKGATAEDDANVIVVEDVPTCPAGQHWDPTTSSCVPDQTGNAIDISKTWSNGHSRTFTHFDPDDSHTEVRADGGTAATIDGQGNATVFGDRRRFYEYYNNYQSVLTLTLIPKFASSGDDCSLKLRSRHNEGGAPENRLGGFGWAIGPDSWDAKVEPYHNVHQQLASGKLPKALVNGQHYPLRFTLTDKGGKVHHLGEIDYGQGFVKIGEWDMSSPKPYMLDVALYMKKSYLWLRNNGAKNVTTVRDVKLELIN